MRSVADFFDVPLGNLYNFTILHKYLDAAPLNILDRLYYFIQYLFADLVHIGYLKSSGRDSLFPFISPICNTRPVSESLTGKPRRGWFVGHACMSEGNTP